jgi:hypothetical protein
MAISRQFHHQAASGFPKLADLQKTVLAGDMGSFWEAALKAQVR